WSEWSSGACRPSVAAPGASARRPASTATGALVPEHAGACGNRPNAGSLQWHVQARAHGGSPPRCFILRFAKCVFGISADFQTFRYRSVDGSILAIALEPPVMVYRMKTAAGQCIVTSVLEAVACAQLVNDELPEPFGFGFLDPVSDHVAQPAEVFLNLLRYFIVRPFGQASDGNLLRNRQNLLRAICGVLRLGL